MTEERDSALSELKDKYKSLKHEEREDGLTVISGAYALDASYDGIHLTEDFEISITVPPSFPLGIPKVKEISSKIPLSYEHLYADRSFCLGVNGEIMMGLIASPSLVSFLEGPIRSFLYAAVFHDRYKRYPYGDRPHGFKGILQFYSELFGVEGDSKAAALMHCVANSRYRGHAPCPCGSEIRARYCHGDQIIDILNGPLLETLKMDYVLVARELVALQHSSY